MLALQVCTQHTHTDMVLSCLLHTLLLCVREKSHPGVFTSALDADAAAVWEELDSCQ